MSESRSPDVEGIEKNNENNENISEKLISYGKKITKQIQGWDGKVSRAQIWVLIILGMLFLLIGSLISAVLPYVGFLLIVAGLYLGLRSGGILRKEQVLDSWGMLIENGQGMSNEVFQATSDFIKESKAPSLNTRKDKMSPGVIGSMLGTKRDFLVVNDQNLSAYQVFINVRDYGANLDVSWYLTYRPSFFKALLHLFRSSAFALTELDLFQQQDLNAYATVCHHSALKAVENLMQKLNQDTTKINRKSKGFLGIS